MYGTFSFPVEIQGCFVKCTTISTRILRKHIITISHSQCSCLTVDETNISGLQAVFKD